jgi:5-methylcytosine-specific restriction endonuclease McrA
MSCGNCNKYIAYGESSIFSIENRKRKILCQHCYDAKMQANREKMASNNFIGAHISRARKLGLRCDLTLDQWNETKAHFKNRCAYCQREATLSIEHFVPYALGGGTTRSNCVPACGRCNHLKTYKHPSLVKRIPKEDIERIRSYLMDIE